MPDTTSDVLVSSARTASLLALVIAYVGLALVWPYERWSQELQTARRALAATLVRDLVDRGSSRDRDLIDSRFESLRSEDMRTYHAVSDFTVRLGPARSPSVLLVEVGGLGTTWRVGLRSEDLQGDDDLEVLRTSARQLGLDFNQSVGAVELFARIQTLVIEKVVDLRPLGLSFSFGMAPWMIAVAAIVLVLVVRNCIRRAAIATDLGVGGVWIAIDSTAGLESCVAALWVLGIGAAPVVAAGSLLYMEVVNHVVIGAELTTMGSIRAMSPVTLVAAASWVSATTVGALINLRFRRLEIT